MHLTASSNQVCGYLSGVLNNPTLWYMHKQGAHSNEHHALLIAKHLSTRQLLWLHISLCICSMYVCMYVCMYVTLRNANLQYVAHTVLYRVHTQLHYCC